jgi:hypothetical protein
VHPRPDDPADHGEPDHRLVAALAAPDSPQGRAALLAAFVDARVFAGINAAATAEQTAEATGLRAESSAQMAVLLLEVPDGTRALPVFPDLLALRRFRIDARPVALTGAQACAAARDEGAAALVVDPAGAARVLDAREVGALADGWVPVTGTRLTSRRAETPLEAATAPAALTGALRAALAGERLRSARVLRGPDGLVLGVAARAPLAPAALAALASRVVTRLGPALPPEGLDLAEVPAEGPGQELLARPRWGLRRGR